jgi:predicted nucleic acid-binding protein
MTRFRRIFFDTGAYIALADTSDRHHEASVAFLKAMGPHCERLTSWGVIAETYTWLRYHLRPAAASAWLAAVGRTERTGTTRVLYPDAALDDLARRQLDRFPDQRLSYVDGLTLAILRSHPGIDAVFAFDRHLTLADVILVPAAV